MKKRSINSRDSKCIEQHIASGKCFEKLPEPVQKVSKKNFELLRTNPSYTSLHFKKVGKFWSVRIGLNHRALAIEDGEDFIWVWIGTHDEYERMIKG